MLIILMWWGYVWYFGFRFYVLRKVYVLLCNSVAWVVYVTWVWLFSLSHIFVIGLDMSCLWVAFKDDESLHDI